MNEDLKEGWAMNFKELELQQKADGLYFDIERLIKKLDVIGMEMDRLKAVNGELVTGIQALLKLLDDGDIVRNTDNDHDHSQFVQQGLRITSALALCKEAISKSTAL